MTRTASTTLVEAVVTTPWGEFAAAGTSTALTRLRFPDRLRIGAAGAAAKAPAGGPAWLAPLTAFLNAFTAGRASHALAAKVPVDISTMGPFHQAVLTALRNVPPGETVSYGELAARAGNPAAARAVGAAMHANPIPLVIPCHRVLAASKRIGGFSAPGGAETKRWLLEHEGAGLFRTPSHA